MKKFIIFLLISLFIFVPADQKLVENQAILLTSAENSNTDNIKTISHQLVDSEGNYYIAGETTLTDIYLMKFSSEGKQLWFKVIGGNDTDIIMSVLLDHNNDIVIIGETLSSDFPTINAFQSEHGGFAEVFITKFSKEGNILWSSYLGGQAGDTVLVNNPLKFDSKNNLIIVGKTIAYELIDDEYVHYPAGNFPIVNGINGGFKGWSDSFIVSITPNGELQWSTYLGGSEIDLPMDFRLDSEDNIIISVQTYSDDFPTTEGAFRTDPIVDRNINPLIDSDGAVSKISSSGVLLWSTLIPANGTVQPINLVIDEEDNIIIVGASNSDDYPTTPNAFQKSLSQASDPSVEGGNFDTVISKFDMNGNIIFSTYLGGGSEEELLWYKNNQFFDQRSGILDLRPIVKVDFDGNVIIMGITPSSNFPTTVTADEEFALETSNSYDIYLTKFLPNGSVVFSTYVGGNHIDLYADLLIDSQNNLFIGGSTVSTDLEISGTEYSATHSGGWDSFLIRYSPQGEVQWRTYLGGVGADQLFTFTFDNNENLLLIGQTDSSDFPLVNPSQEQIGGGVDGFIARFSLNGELLWSTFIGGGGDEDISRFLLTIDHENNILLTGVTSSIDFPVSESAHESKLNGESDAFITKYDEAGIVLFSSYAGQLKSQQDNSEIEIWLIAVLILLTGFGILVGVSYFHRNRSGSVIFSGKVSDILSPIFNSKPSLAYLFVGQSVIKDKRLENEIRSEIPFEIFSYKFILHPVRLSIVKILYENAKITTTELKEIMGIQWGELHRHLKVLANDGYLVIEQQFVEDALKIVIQTEPKAITEFQKLRGLLSIFLETAPNLDNYLDATLELVTEDSSDDMYPLKN